MAPALHVSKTWFQRKNGENFDEKFGVVLGYGSASDYYVFQAIFVKNDDTIPTQLVQVLNSLPGGISLLGFFSFSADFDAFINRIPFSARDKGKANSVKINDTILFATFSNNNVEQPSFQLATYDSEKEQLGYAEKIESFSWKSPIQLSRLFVTLFAEVSLTLKVAVTKRCTPEMVQSKVIEHFDKLSYSLKASHLWFAMKPCSLILAREENESIFGNVKPNSTIADLRNLRLAKKQRLSTYSHCHEPLQFDCLYDACKEREEMNELGALQVYTIVEPLTVWSIPQKFKAIGLVLQTNSLQCVHETLSCSISRCVQQLKLAVLSFSDFQQKQVIKPISALFLLPSELLFVTQCFPDSSEDSSSAQMVRQQMHNTWNVPVDRCQFRVNNEFAFFAPSSRIRRIHQLVNAPDECGRLATVQGSYSYYHYLQDSFDDRGWGCAYRTLQTIWSWFVENAYTEVPIPNHKEIQKMLIEIADFPATFLGSKKWIGSLELNYCLSHCLKIDSRVLPLKSALEMDDYAEELLMHFENEGTPIMIGGGVLAHNIIGVHIDTETRACKYLVLDPHYSGEEDCQVILQKGWCSWKPASFWSKESFYNLLLPMRPKIF